MEIRGVSLRIPTHSCVRPGPGDRSHVFVSVFAVAGPDPALHAFGLTIPGLALLARDFAEAICVTSAQPWRQPSRAEP